MEDNTRTLLRAMGVSSPREDVRENGEVIKCYNDSIEYIGLHIESGVDDDTVHHYMDLVGVDQKAQNKALKLHHFVTKIQSLMNQEHQKVCRLHKTTTYSERLLVKILPKIRRSASLDFNCRKQM